VDFIVMCLIQFKIHSNRIYYVKYILNDFQLANVALLGTIS